MSSKKTPETDHPHHAAAWRRLRDLSGPPPLLAGEDHDAYEALWMGIAQAIGAKDFVEFIDVQNLADATWTDWRRRRCEPGILKAAIPSAIARLLSGVIGPKAAEGFANNYREGDEEDRADVEAALADHGFTMDDVRGVAFQIRMLDLETLQSMGAKTQWRRSAIHREIGRRRDSLARQARRAEVDGELHAHRDANTKDANTKYGNAKDANATPDAVKART